MPSLSYLEAVHAIQSGVAMEQQRERDAHMAARGISDPTDWMLNNHKHLRVGINTTKCEHAALVGLLLEGGIITQEQYLEALTLQVNAEVEADEKRLSQAFGTKIVLR